MAAVDSAWAIAVDSAGSAYVTGYSNSTNFPTQSPFQANLAGQENAFVTKVAPAGNTLVWSTYLGGSGADQSLAIAVDSQNSPYIVGNTSSSNFPTHAPYQSTNNGQDTFLAKFSPNGSSLVYSTYLGGGSMDTGFGVAVDSAGSAYVTGQAFSTNFPTTTSAFQTVNNGGGNGSNAYLTKFSPNGGSLLYSTFLGGTTVSGDQASAIAVDSEGSAYITGIARSANFPTLEAFQTTNRDNYTAFVTKFGPNGDSLVYSTFLGGTTEDFGQGIAVDGAGAAYLTGTTYSTNFPTQSPFQSTNLGGGAFVTKIAPYPSPNEYPLTVTASPSNGGAVSAIPTSKNGSYAFGTSVQLTALPANGYGFVGFTGDLTGSANPQSLVISTARSVTATFAPLAILSVASHHTGNFMQGQMGATYAITVSNASGAPATNGQITVAESLPAGLTLVSMNGGATWNCSTLPSCTTSSVLAAGSNSSITVTINVSGNAGSPLTNHVTVSGGNSATANGNDSTTIIDACDVKQVGSTTALDVQAVINQALGISSVSNDLNNDGRVNIGDVQLVVSSAIGNGCYGS